MFHQDEITARERVRDFLSEAEQERIARSAIATDSLTSRRIVRAGRAAVGRTLIQAGAVIAGDGPRD